jgi:hypothetical protein
MRAWSISEFGQKILIGVISHTNELKGSLLHERQFAAHAATGVQNQPG